MTSAQRVHQAIMRAVAQAIQQDTRAILKGGTGLLFTRGLDRHSTDLDFDSPARLALEKRVQHGFQNAGVPLLQLQLKKRQRDNPTMCGSLSSS